MEDKPEAEPANSTVVINIEEEEKNNPVEDINEKFEKTVDYPKHDNDTRVKCKGIIKIRQNNERRVYVSGDPNTYGYGQQPYYPQQQGYYPQQQGYYPQQQIAGQVVYVQGPPPPQDASRMSPYRARDTSYTNSTVYNDDIFGRTFDDRAVRHRFIQRVYTLLTVQLAFSTLFILMCIYVLPIRTFVSKNWVVAIVVMFVLIITMYMLICYKKLRRAFPLNFILLSILTLCMSYEMAYISTRYPNIIVVTAIGITTVVCLLVSIFAIQTKFDITGWGMYLMIAFIIIALFGVIAMFIAIFTEITVVYIIYSALMAIVLCFFLMYDTQCIIGGRRIELSPEEYILGALQLYIDIMYIFQYILMFVGLISNN